MAGRGRKETRRNLFFEYGTATACMSSAMWRVEEMTGRSTDPSATTQFIASELQPRSASGAMRELGTHLPLPPHVSVAGDVLC